VCVKGELLTHFPSDKWIWQHDKVPSHTALSVTITSAGTYTIHAWLGHTWHFMFLALKASMKISRHGRDVGMNVYSQRGKRFEGNCTQWRLMTTYFLHRISPVTKLLDLVIQQCLVWICCILFVLNNMGNGDHFCGGKVARAWSWLPLPCNAEVKNMRS